MNSYKFTGNYTNTMRCSFHPEIIHPHPPLVVLLLNRVSSNTLLHFTIAANFSSRFRVPNLWNITEPVPCSLFVPQLRFYHFAGRYGSEEQRLIYGRENFIQSNDFSRTIKIGLAPCQVYTLSQCAPSPPGRPRPPRGKETHNGPIAKGWRSICADSLRSLGQPDRAVNQGLVMVLGCVDWRGNSACCLKPVWCLAIMHASSINKHNEWSSRVQRSDVVAAAAEG